MHAHKDFLELKRRVKSQGLLKKQPLYQYGSFATHITLMLLGFGILMLFPDYFYLQLFNACFLGFVYTQVAFFGHDSGHRQMSPKMSRNSTIGLLTGLLVGISWREWVYSHNKHHASPNHEEDDPDLDIPVLAFTKAQIENKHPFIRNIMQYQWIYFPLVLPFESISIRIGGIQYLLRTKSHRLELVSMILHCIGYFGIIVYFLPLPLALLFVIIHQGVFGMYLGCAFATNHIGMPHVDASHTLDYVRLQVLTARNINPTPIVTYLYGGLNYQTEHHLFPEVARNKLREVSTIVKAFCKEKNIRYHETSILAAYREVLTHLYIIGQSAK